jgi:hypothetical protein
MQKKEDKIEQLEIDFWWDWNYSSCSWRFLTLAAASPEYQLSCTLPSSLACTFLSKSICSTNELRRQASALEALNFFSLFTSPGPSLPLRVSRQHAY